MTNNKIVLWFLFVLCCLLFFIQGNLMIAIISMFASIFSLLHNEKIEIIINFIFIKIHIPNTFNIYILFFSSFLFIFLFSFISNKILSYFLSLFSENIRKSVLQNFDNNIKKEELLSVISGDVDNVENLLNIIVKSFIQGPIFIIFGFISIIGIFPQYWLIIFIFILISMIILLFVIIYSYYQFKKERRKIDKFNKNIIEIFENIETIKTYQIENKIGTDFKKDEKKWRKIVTKSIFSSSFSLSLIFLIENFIVFFVYYQFSNDASISELNSFIYYISLISTGITITLFSIFFISKGKNSWERIKNTKKKNDNFAIKYLEEMEEWDKIILKNILFKNNEKVIFQKLNFKIRNGSKNIIYGDSGSGKTTLLKIITSQLTSFQGDILIDGKDAQKNINYKKIFSFCNQDVFLFKGSIIENFKFYNPEITNKEILKYLGYVNLSSLIKNETELINFKLDKFGDNVSGGQKKRLALAMSISKKAEVLIVDDVTSGLDQKNKECIFDLIFSNKLNFKTILFITSDKNLRNKNATTFKLWKGGIYEI